jgi:hypothetical protein
MFQCSMQLWNSPPKQWLKAERQNTTQPPFNVIHLIPGLDNFINLESQTYEAVGIILGTNVVSFKNDVGKIRMGFGSIQHSIKLTSSMCITMASQF